MKRLLLLLVFCLMLAAPVMATSATFQNGRDGLACYGDTGGSCTWHPNLTGGNSYYQTDYSGGSYGGIYHLTTSTTSPSTYAAGTLLSQSSGCTAAGSIILYDSSHSTMYNFNGLAASKRYEVNIVGTTARLYSNGALAATSSALATTPAYIGFGEEACNFIGAAAWDNLIIGTSEIRNITSVPEQNAYFIKKDMVNPSASGFYNTTTGALVSSNYIEVAWARSNLTPAENMSIDIINVDSGTIYSTQYTGTAAYGMATFNINTDIILAGAPYGRYQWKMGDYYSDEIAYIANGASIAFDSASYQQQDTATITYVIDGAYWDTSTYGYAIKIYSGNDWSVVKDQDISASSGTVTYQFTDANTQGTYYAVVEATPNVGGDPIWMNYDYAQLNAYAKFTGYVNNETGYPQSSANVSFSQTSIISNSITTADGNYTATGFITGAMLTINVTKAGYSQYYVTFVPMVAKSIPMNITLNSTTPSYIGLGIGGIARDGILTGTTITSGYGRPIGGATCYLRNQSNGESCSNITNMAAWYLFDEGNGCFLTTARLYDVWCSKLGYSNSPNYTVVAA